MTMRCGIWKPSSRPLSGSHRPHPCEGPGPRVILTTQLYFPDLPENETDFFYHPDLEVTVLDQDAAGNMIAEFNFVIDENSPPPCPGDTDSNDEVDVNDLLVVIAGWNNPYTVDDLLDVIAGWGPCS